MASSPSAKTDTRVDVFCDISKRICRCAGALLLAGAIVIGPVTRAVASDLELVQLIAAGRVEAARTRFAALNPTPLDWLFFDARVAKANGKLTIAITMFREVLRRDPAYIAAQRELAHSLLLAQDYKGAAHLFRQLMRIDPDASQRRSYVHFLDEIDRLRPFTLNSRFAIISSSNINRGSSQNRFQPGVPNAPAFDITSTAEPGTGIEIGLTGRHLWRRENGYRWTMDWDVAAREFEDTGQNSIFLHTRVHYARLSENARWSLGPTIRRTWTDDQADERLDLGLTASVDLRMDDRRTVFFAISAEDRNYLFDDARDGPLYWMHMGVAWPFSKGILSVGARLTINRPALAHIQYDGQTAFAQLSRSWAGGFKGGLGLEIGRRDYAAVFPLAGVPRKDRFLQITLSAQHDALRVGRFIPSVHCTLGRTSSNIAFYDHDIEECTLGITTRF